MEIMETIIRDIKSADHAALRDLYSYSLSQNRDGFVQNPSFHEDIAARAHKFQQNQGAMLGLFDAETDDLIGFGGLRAENTDEKSCELCTVHLHPAYQGKGLGKRLVQALIARAGHTGYQTMRLHVTATQTQALGLYAKLGFENTDRKVYTIEDTDYDTVFMERKIG